MRAKDSPQLCRFSRYSGLETNDYKRCLPPFTALNPKCLPPQSRVWLSCSHLGRTSRAATSSLDYLYLQCHVITHFKSHPGFLLSNGLIVDPILSLTAGVFQITLINMHLSSTCCVISIILGKFMLIKFSVKQLGICVLFLLCPHSHPSNSHKSIPKSNKCSFLNTLLFWIICSMLYFVKRC